MTNIYELKEGIGYDEELGYITPFKVCVIEQIINQDKGNDVLHPEDILKNKEDIEEVTKALKVVKKFLKTAKESQCWLED